MSTDAPRAATRTDDLLAGPRGRRLLLEFLTDGEPETGLDRARPLSRAVSTVAASLDPQRDRVARYVRIVDTDSADSADSAEACTDPGTPDTPEEIARLIGEAVAARPLPEPTSQSLDRPLDLSVCAAMCWQEPDGYDALAAHPAVRAALRPVAEHVAAAPSTNWWWSAPDLTDQWTVTWGEDATPFPGMPPEKRASNLRGWSAHVREGEQRDSGFLERRRPVKNAVGGEWWSMPLWCVPTSTRRWPGTEDPTGALFIEDRDEDDFCATRFTPPPDARILEIAGADDWAALCRDFPLEVTWSHRREWWEVTGRDSREAGPWLIPDWPRVAERWDAVHLTVAGYLAAATRCILVRTTDGADAASVIGGWGPDVTYWLR
jgi:hypothetical protein